MPGKVSENKILLFIENVVSRLKTITLANGYNTQPFVTDDRREYDNSDAQHVLLVTIGTDDVIERQTGQRYCIRTALLVIGNSKIGRESPHRTREALLQDTRTCLCTYVDALQADVGKCDVSLDSCERDEDTLLDANEVMFTLPVQITHWRGEQW